MTLETFNPNRLTLARRRRGLTKKRLADVVGISDRSITAYEAGEMSPSTETVQDLGRALKFPVDFFSGPDLHAPSWLTASFRALSSMTAGKRDAALGAGAIAIHFNSWIDQRFSLPRPTLPNLRGQPPEAAAAALRAHWGLGERAITNMVHLLESKGVRVFSLAEECLEVDAFSLWHDGTPFVFLNTMKSAEHGRFDAAHELGHLILHEHGPPKGQEVEREADAFASAFLMPKASVLASVPKFVTLASLIKLKKCWKVSVAALAYRLQALGVLSEWHYRNICVQISSAGYRKMEPEGIPRETSQIMSKVMNLLKEEGITKHDVAKQLSIHPSELDALVFGFVMTPLSGGRPGGRTSSPSGKLRLV